MEGAAAEMVVRAGVCGKLWPLAAFVSLGCHRWSLSCTELNLFCTAPGAVVEVFLGLFKARYTS